MPGLMENKRSLYYSMLESAKNTFKTLKTQLTT